MAEKGLKGFCHSCGAELIPKCGSIKTNHWAHKAGDCDPWAEPETQWHINWKKLFLPDEQEVNIGAHRADIKTRHAVVELQHSAISVDEIREREQFYGNMMWVFDCQKQYKNNQIFHGLQKDYIEKGLFIQEIWWRWSKPSILACTKPVLLHLKKGVLLNIYAFGNSTRLGLGHLITSKAIFLREARKTLGTDESVIRNPAHYPQRRQQPQTVLPASEYDHYEPTDEEIERMEEWADDGI